MRPEDQLYDLSMHIGLDSNEDQLRQLTKITEEVQRRERQFSILWKLHNKSKWMKLGDAPNAYFFLLIQGKRAREAMKALALPDGKIIEDEGEIL